MKFWSLQLVKEAALKKQVELEAELECQIFEDEEEKIRLSFTPPAPLPSDYRKPAKIPFSAGVYNLVKNILNECRP